MPPVNPVISAGVIAISVAVVAAIVVYENPEVRRLADNLKHRIAVAVQSMNPEAAEAARRRRNSTAEDEPIFNRPEDAEGFLMSRSGRSDANHDVVADDATRRQQREEIMYWNRQQMQQQRGDQQRSRSTVSSNTNTNSTSWQPREALEAVHRATIEAAAAAGITIPSFGINQNQSQSQSQSQSSARPNTSFDHFLRPDTSADRGTYVMNTNTAEAFGTTSSSSISPNAGAEQLRRRRPEAIVASYTNPFADEYGIELDEHEVQEQIRAYEEATKSKRQAQDVPVSLAADAANASDASAYRSVNPVLSPSSDNMSGIYSATEPDTNAAANNHNDHAHDAVFDPLPVIAEQQPAAPVSPVTLSSVTGGAQSEVFFDVDNEMSNSAVHTEAFNSIQAWAQNSSSASLAGFYSPLPVTPTEDMSEPSEISSVGDGELTPTGSMSIIGSVAGSDAGSAPSIVADSAAGSAAGDYGVVSDSSDGITTPTSWSDVGSVVSENDAHVHA